MTREDVVRWSIALALAVGIWLAGWLMRRLVLAGVSHLARRTRTDLDELLLATLRPHVPIWFLLLGITVAVRYGTVGTEPIPWVDKSIVAGYLLSLTLALSSFLTRLVDSRSKQWSEALPATTLTRNAIRIVVIGLGALVVAGNLGIAIAPLLTALGIGSLAVALALQPTLTNLFAGFHIMLARHVRVGDFVELEGGHQGYITDIGWRSTLIRELADNLIIVPNSRIAEIIIKNYSLPAPPLAVLVQVGVAYGSNLDEVERVTVQTAREIQRTAAGADETFDPFIRYHSFGDSSINFTVILRAKQFAERSLITHEFVKLLQRGYAAAGIEIPFPQRVVHLPPGDGPLPVSPPAERA